MQKNYCGYYGIVHTGQFLYQISRNERKRFLKDYEKHLIESGDRANIYKFPAIKIIVMKYLPRMYFTVDFVNLIGSLYVGENSYEIIMDEINSYIKKPEKLTLYRIDFRVDVELESQAMVQEILQVYKKTKTHNRMLIRMEKNKKKDITDESLYYKSKKADGNHKESIRVNIYNKLREREDNRKDKAGYENIIRYEVQLYNKNLIYMKRKGKDKTLEKYLTYESILKYFSNYILPVVFTGNHYKLSKAIHLIEADESISKRDRRNLVEFVLLIDDFDLDYVKDNYSYYLFSKYIRMLGRLGINPLIIPSYSIHQIIYNPLARFLQDKGKLGNNGAETTLTVYQT